MYFKLEQNDNIYNSYNEDIADNKKKNYYNYNKNNNYEKEQQNYNKKQIIESSPFISFKKKIDDNNNKLNDADNDISSSMTLSRSEMGEYNELLYPQNNNWIPYQKKNSITSENNYYPKNKKNNFNQYRQKFKKGKKNKNINYMNNANMSDFMAHMSNNISYDDSKVDIPIMNNNKIDANDLNNNSNNSQINNNIYQNNNNIIIGQNNYYRIAQRNKGFFNKQILRNQNGINDYNNNYNYNYNKNLRQNFNLNKANLNMNITNRNKNYINNFIPSKTNNYDLENLSIKKVNSQGNYTDPNYSKKLSNKFNTNNSLDNIVNFYNNPNFNPNNNFILNNNIDFFKNNNNYINNTMNNNMSYTNIINNNNVNNKAISEQKEGLLKQLNIRIKLGENSSEKNIIIDINNDNKTNIVNNIIKDNNLDQSYFEALLNIVENAVDILNNFDKLKVARYKINKKFESKESFKENNLNLNDSFILYLIENNIYKKFSDEIKPDKYNLEMKQIRNFSFNFKRNKFKNKLFFD